MKYALLIDSENARPALDEIIQEVSKYGDTPIRYLVGDFTKEQSKHWISICQKHAISCIQTMNFTNGKNSLDISLVIEGMKILFEKSYIDGIVIVASDSDYTPLCREWRNRGKDVIGIGRYDSPESYRASCTKFIFTENIYAKDTKEDKKETKPDFSMNKIKAFVYQVMDANNGKCQMSLVCESLIKAYPDFDTRSFGYSKSIDFFRGEFKELNITEDIKNTYFLSYRDDFKPEAVRISLPKKKEVLPKTEEKKPVKRPMKKLPERNKYTKPRRKETPVKVSVSREEVNDDLNL